MPVRHGRVLARWQKSRYWVTQLKINHASQRMRCESTPQSWAPHARKTAVRTIPK
jgi:hypothetical protein